MTGNSWSASQYVRFEDERNRPIVDLLARLPATGVATAIDIGCGPGNSTAYLRARYPDAIVTGIDSSADMIVAAKERLPAIDFAIADIATWDDPGPFDIILANAALQWLPDHERLFPALMARLARGGSLAVQMPDNLDEPAHRLMRKVAADGPWAHKLARSANARAPRHEADWYYRLLYGHASTIDIWRTTYHHRLEKPAAIVEWFKGSGLRPFLDPLDSDERAAFLERYEAAVAEAHPPLPDNGVLLPFPRLFIVATR